ncbi:MAG: TonB family protein [Bacteroidia bacterium]|nr:TonB family protein [Bacteroidia bacterium]
MNIFKANSWEQAESKARVELVFEGRNKQYGAYAIRNKYHRNKIIAMLCAPAMVAAIAGVFLIQIPEVKAEKPGISIYTKPDVIDTIYTIADDAGPEYQEKTDVSAGENAVPEIGIDLPERPFSGSGVGASGLGDPFATAGLGSGTQTEDIRGLKNSKRDTFVYPKPDFECVFPPTEDAFREYITQSFRTPRDCMSEGIEGYALVRFMVDQYGKVSRVSIVESNRACEGFNEEVIRVIQKSPRWIPGMVNGRVVNSWRQIPIRLTY